MKCSFEITTKAASAALNFKNLIAGIEQHVDLVVSSGSFIFPKEATITLKCSKYLKIREIHEISDSSEEQNDQIKEFKSDATVKLYDVKPFQERIIPIAVICDLLGQRDEKLIEQKITLQCPWSRNDVIIPLSFMPGKRMIDLSKALLNCDLILFQLWLHRVVSIRRVRANSFR